MAKYRQQKTIAAINVLVSLFFFCVKPAAAGVKSSATPNSPKQSAKTTEDIDNQVLTVLQKEARAYREEGVQFQKEGSLDQAMSLFQKALEMDPGYAIAYNDVGIIYESMGTPDRAEESYLKAIRVDPYFLSSYSNLALLYENKRQLDKAAFFWQKRVELGRSDDPWTQKARRRLNDIKLVQGIDAASGYRQEQVVDLLKDVSTAKSSVDNDSLELSRIYFKRAKQGFSKGDNLNAYRDALNAMQLDPKNDEISGFVEELHQKLLSR